MVRLFSLHLKMMNCRPCLTTLTHINSVGRQITYTLFVNSIGDVVHDSVVYLFYFTFQFSHQGKGLRSRDHDS